MKLRYVARYGTDAWTLSLSVFHRGSARRESFVGVGHVDVSDLVGRISQPESFVCQLRSADGSRSRGWLSFTVQSFLGLVSSLDSTVSRVVVPVKSRPRTAGDGGGGGGDGGDGAARPDGPAVARRRNSVDVTDENGVRVSRWRWDGIDGLRRSCTVVAPGAIHTVACAVMAALV